MADTTTITPPIQSAAPYGSALVGTFLAAVIYGITLLQSFLYYHKYHRDRLHWKVLVGVVLVLDTISLSLFMRAMYYFLVESWGVPDMASVDIVSGFPAEYIISAILTFIVQLFYINTIRALHAPIVVPLVLLALSTTALVTGLMLPAIQIHFKLIPVIVGESINHLAFNIARSTALVTDIGVVACLCFQLRMRTARQAAGSRAVTLLLAFALQRGVLQAIVQAGEVIAYAVAPHGVYFLPFHVIVTRVYSTSLLVTLTTRDYVLHSQSRPSVTTRETSLPAPPSRGPVFTSMLDPPQLFSFDSSEVESLPISILNGSRSFSDAATQRANTSATKPKTHMLTSDKWKTSGETADV